MITDKLLSLHDQIQQLIDAGAVSEVGYSTPNKQIYSIESPLYLNWHSSVSGAEYSADFDIEIFNQIIILDNKHVLFCIECNVMLRCMGDFGSNTGYWFTRNSAKIN